MDKTSTIMDASMALAVDPYLYFPIGVEKPVVGDDRGEMMVPDAGVNESKAEKLSLRQVVDAYLKSSKHDPEDVEACFGTCKHQAYQLAKTLKKHGYDAELLQLSEPSKELIDKKAHPNWLGFLQSSKYARSYMTHYVVQVDDKIIDITGRQFGTKNSGSLIHSKGEFLKKWKKAFVVDSPIKIESTTMLVGGRLGSDRCSEGNYGSLMLSELRELIAQDQVLSEMKIVKIGDQVPKSGWDFIAFRDKIWLVDPEKWKKSDGKELYKTLANLVGKKTIPNPKDFESFHNWTNQINEILVDVFVGSYSPDDAKITAYHTDAPSFRSSHLVKKVAKALGAMSIEYYGNSDNDSDFADFFDKRDKLPDVFYHGTSSKFLFGILSKGLTPGQKTNWSGDKFHGTFNEHVFVVDSYTHAKFHANDTARKRGGDPVVLEVRIPDKDKLQPDWDADSVSKSKKKNFNTTNPDRREQSTVGSWKTTKHMGRYAYKGRIPASHIRLYAWSADSAGDDEGGEWNMRYPGDEEIWKRFENTLKSGDYEEIADAWLVAFEEPEDEEDDEYAMESFVDMVKNHRGLDEVYTDFSSATIDLLNHKEWRDLFFKEPDEKKMKAFRKFLRDNKDKQVVLYHGTGSRNKVMEQGLLPTSHNRRRSMQSGSGYVYMSVHPGMARTFGEMGYPEDKVVVYAVTVPIHKLSPDKDQLRNKRLWDGYEGEDDLASSLVYGRGARFKGKIEPWRISVKEGKPIEESALVSPIKNGKKVEIDDLPEVTKDDIVQWLAENIPQLEKDPSIARDNLIGLVNVPRLMVGKVSLSSLEGWKERTTSNVVVKKYTDMFKRGSEPPPILIANGKFLDGGHRAHAATKAGIDEIQAVDITPLIEMDWDKWLAGDEYDPFNEDTVVIEGWEVAPVQEPRHYDQEAKQGEDEYYYHVTTPEAAKSIIKSGLKPGNKAMFDVFGKRSSGKVFLTDIDAVYFWMNALKERLKEKGSDDTVVLLRIPQSEVDRKKLQYDKRGSGESCGNDWYSIDTIGAPKTQNESVLIEGWEVAPEQHPSNYRNGEPDEYYYHVTTKDKVESILRHGIKPNMPATFSNYSSTSKGKVFLTDRDGVDFWMERVELHISLSKDYDEDEDPANDIVVLRIPKNDVKAKLSVDEMGSKDSGANAWCSTQLIEYLTESKERTGGWIGPVYHGSRNKFLKALDIGQHGQGIVMTAGRQETPAIYFTSSKENARFYADPKNEDDIDEYVYLAYVRFKNPLVVDEDHELWKRHSPPQIATKAKKAGHDGFIIKDYTDGAVPSTIFGVFDNDNVRLAGNLKEPGPNLGSDDPIDPDDLIIVPGDDGYYVFFDDKDGNALNGPGPFRTEDEAEREALRLVDRHNASLPVGNKPPLIGPQRGQRGQKG